MSLPLHLPAELTIYTVGEMYPSWLSWLTAAAPAEPGDEHDDNHRVDGSAVDEIDAAGLQLLVSLSRALARQQQTLRIADPSTPLRRACEAFGLSALLAAQAPTGAAA